MSTSNGKDFPQKTDPDLLTRTSWVNAELAYRQVKRGRADGNKCALWVRQHLQRYLYSIGCVIQLHCGKVAFLGVLLLSLCCVGLKTGDIETNVNELWVEEGGRLERELDYIKKTIGDGSWSSFELIIQTPKHGVNLLSHESVMLHLKAVLAATKVKVNVDGLTWDFRDICYAENFSPVDEGVIDQILEDILPCIIVTPLDCFWEGAKLLGPEIPVMTMGIAEMPDYITWENLNPQNILTKLESNPNTVFPVEALRDVFKRAGITTAYQEKPCLNPKDPNCPTTAPNFNGSVPDIATEFTKGCKGFASKYMNWEQDLIFGGIKKNKTGHIVRVEAFQSILRLMSEINLFQYYENDHKVSGIDWNTDKARQVLEAFQRKFTQVVNHLASNSSHKDNVHSFCHTSLMDIMTDFSSISITKLTLGYIFMFVYACVSLLRWNDAVNSQSGVGMAGVTLVCLSVAAGLGVSSVLGIKFNASTTQIIPFLALGLGVDDMFLIAHTYFENSDYVHSHDLTGEVLKRTGVTVLLTSISNVMAFFTAAIIPIPALRAFTLQAAILVLFNLGSVLLVFPAIVSLDLIRREDKRIDVLCCFQSSTSNDVIDLRNHSHHNHHHHNHHQQQHCSDDSNRRHHHHHHCHNHHQQQQPHSNNRGRHELTDLQREPSPPPPYYASSGSLTPPCYDTVTRAGTDGGAVTTLAPNDGVFVKRGDNSMASTGCSSTTSSQQCLTQDKTSISCSDRCTQIQRACLSWNLTCFAGGVYSPFLHRPFVKVTVMVGFLILLCLGAWGTAQVQDGLDLTDVVPRGTPEFEFLEAQSKYFGFYSINLVTKGNFDYANNQQMLYQYHNSFQRVSKIVKREDGSMPAFWLDLFRQWLSDLQMSFDRDYSRKLVTSRGAERNASDETILAYKLLIQTGDPDRPINTEQITRIRLVDDQGNVYPPAFYTYLSAWYSNDAMAYSASMANFHPLPESWYHDPSQPDYKIRKSQQLVYTQIPFYLTNVTTTQDIIDVIMEVRAICQQAEEKGLPNFPSGIIFTFYEQYINLRFYLMLSLLCVLGVAFLVLTVVLMNPWLAFIVVCVLGMILVELFGFMGLAGIKLSAVPAVTLIMAVGIGVEFTIHLAVGFVTSIGSRDRRMGMALEHTFAPVVHGAISTFLGILMLVGTDFDFIIKYFFNVLTALVLLGLFNGLMLLPVLLSIFGPNGEVIPKDNPNCLATPTPEPSPRMDRRFSSSSHSSRSHRSSRRIYPRINSDISLSTISEEPTQYSSHEIIVQPELVVETTTLPGTVDENGGFRPASNITKGGRGSGSGTTSTGANNTTTTTTLANTNAGGDVGSPMYSDSSCRNSISSIDSPLPHPPPNVTRVKATATVKVEVHTPIPAPISQNPMYKSKRRKNREQGMEQCGSDSDCYNSKRQRSRDRDRERDGCGSGSNSGNGHSHSQYTNSSRNRNNTTSHYHHQQQPQHHHHHHPHQPHPPHRRSSRGSSSGSAGGPHVNLSMGDVHHSTTEGSSSSGRRHGSGGSGRRSRRVVVQPQEDTDYYSSDADCSQA